METFFANFNCFGRIMAEIFVMGNSKSINFGNFHQRIAANSGFDYNDFENNCIIASYMFCYRGIDLKFHIVKKRILCF
jgi:hypothetical protein